MHVAWLQSQVLGYKGKAMEEESKWTKDIGNFKYLEVSNKTDS